MRCLIVDDEPRICYGLRELIDWEALGFPVRDVAFSADEALEKHRADPYSLIVADIKMPGTDGLSMIRQIRSFDSEVYFIIISGYGEFEYARTALQYDVSDYILKPVDENQLSEQVKKISEKLGLRLRDEESGSTKARSVDFAAIQIYVDNHFTEDISLHELAGHFFVNQAYLGRMFREQTGRKFNDYLNALRINRAARMLRDPACRVSDACTAVGYRDVAYFYKKFKEIMGKIPSEYREQYEKVKNGIE